MEWDKAVRRDTRGESSVRFVATDAGNPFRPPSDAAFRESLLPQRRGAPPAERQAKGDRAAQCPTLVGGDVNRLAAPQDYSPVTVIIG